MPDEHYDDDEAEQESSVMRDLRKKAKRADALEDENGTLRQKVAILEAGITDLTPAKQKALLAAHEGDLSPEALRATATDLGFIAEEKPEPQVSAEEQAAHQAMAEATAAAEPSEAQVKTLQDRMRAAKSPEELAAILAEENLLYSDE